MLDLRIWILNPRSWTNYEGTDQLQLGTCIASQQSDTGSTVANVVRIGPHFKQKRKRIGSDYVKDMLVDLFDIQPFYTFKDLLDITNQSEVKFPFINNYQIDTIM